MEREGERGGGRNKEKEREGGGGGKRKERKKKEDEKGKLHGESWCMRKGAKRGVGRKGLERD